MRRIGVLVLFAMVLAGCGSGSSGGTSAGAHVTPTVTPSPTASVDRATVTAALKKIAAGARQLEHISGTSLSAIDADLSFARVDFKAGASLLTPTPAGVPDLLARRTVLDVNAISTTLRSVISCYESNVLNPSNCKFGGAIKRTGSRVGADLRRLAPYSNVTVDQLNI